METFYKKLTEEQFTLEEQETVTRCIENRLKYNPLLVAYIQIIVAGNETTAKRPKCTEEDYNACLDNEQTIASIYNAAEQSLAQSYKNKDKYIADVKKALVYFADEKFIQSELAIEKIENALPLYVAGLVLIANNELLQIHPEWITDEIIDYVEEAILPLYPGRCLPLLDASEREKIARIFFLAPKKKERKKAEITTVKKPTVYSSLNSKVANNVCHITDVLSTESNGQLSFFVNEPDDGQKFPLRIGTTIVNKRKKDVVTYVAFSYTGELEYNKARIKRFDKAVLDAICTLWQAGNKTMTLTDIHRLMCGYSAKGDSMTKQRLERYRISILKLAGTRIYIDYTEEINTKYALRDDKRLASGKYDSMLLTYEGFDAIQVNGKQTYALTIDKTPVLLSYSADKGELLSYNVDWLSVPVNENEDLTAIKFELLNHIDLIKKKQYNSPCINLENLYRAAGVSFPSDKTQRSRERGYIKKMLDYWQTKGVFSSYEEYKSQNKVIGYKIRFVKSTDNCIPSTDNCIPSTDNCIPSTDNCIPST